MSGVIYLVKNDGELVEMREKAYDSEDILQGLLADYPNLLAGDQIDSGTPRRWLLVSREVGLPCEEEAPSRWSVDHLFLDQDAIPTIIEVKRSSDTRIRREVIGQMIEYAANAVVYWPVEKLKSIFETRCDSEKVDASMLLAEHLGSEKEPGEFWEDVKTNLQAGKVRLVFVSDEISTELRRVIEFLNDQMDPAEVLGIEVKQYKGGKLRTLVPRVVGITKTDRKGSTKGEQWQEDTFFKALKSRHSPEMAKVARTILDWAENTGLRVNWGRGKIDGTYNVAVEWQGRYHSMFSVSTNGYVQVAFTMMAELPPLTKEQRQLEILNSLNVILGTKLPKDSISKWPSFSYKALRNLESLKRFLDVFDRIVKDVANESSAVDG